MFTTPFTFMAAPAGGGFDPDAQAFFDAVGASGGTLTATEESAVNQLVVDLKGYGLWDSLHAYYPFVGQSEISTSFNLIDPSLYKIDWIANPSLPNFLLEGVQGTNTGGINNGGFGMSNFNPALDFTIDQYGMGFYVHSTIAEADSGEHYLMGANSIFGTFETPRLLLGQNDGSTARARAGVNGLIDFPMPSDNGQGLWQVTRNGTSTTYAYFDGVEQGSNTETVSSFTNENFEILILAMSLYNPNADGEYRPTRKTGGYCFIDKGMTSVQAANMKIVGDTFMANKLS